MRGEPAQMVSVLRQSHCPMLNAAEDKLGIDNASSALERVKTMESTHDDRRMRTHGGICMRELKKGVEYQGWAGDAGVHAWATNTPRNAILSGQDLKRVNFEDI